MSISVADPIKDSAVEAVRALRGEGIRVVMLTGDNRTTAEAVARAVGIDHVEANVLPDQKAAVVKDLQGKGERVAMAGDGINDAPALAQAHVGIAMGTGTDVAMESAGVTLVKGDLRGIVRARRLSRATIGNIRQDLFSGSSTTWQGCRSLPESSIVVRHPAEPDDRERRNDVQLGFRNRQRSAIASAFSCDEQRPHPAWLPTPRIGVYSNCGLETANQRCCTGRPGGRAGLGAALRGGLRLVCRDVVSAPWAGERTVR
jgi:soluble P-type ATPase